MKRDPELQTELDEVGAMDEPIRKAVHPTLDHAQLNCPRCDWKSLPFNSLGVFYTASADYKDHYRATHSDGHE